MLYIDQNFDDRVSFGKWESERVAGGEVESQKWTLFFFGAGEGWGRVAGPRGSGAGQ